MYKRNSGTRGIAFPILPIYLFRQNLQISGSTFNADLSLCHKTDIVTGRNNPPHRKILRFPIPFSNGLRDLNGKPAIGVLKVIINTVTEVPHTVAELIPLKFIGGSIEIRGSLSETVTVHMNNGNKVRIFIIAAEIFELIGRNKTFGNRMISESQLLIIRSRLHFSF